MAQTAHLIAAFYEERIHGCHGWKSPPQTANPQSSVKAVVMTMMKINLVNATLCQLRIYTSITNASTVFFPLSFTLFQSDRLLNANLLRKEHPQCVSLKASSLQFLLSLEAFFFFFCKTTTPHSQQQYQFLLQACVVRSINSYLWSKLAEENNIQAKEREVITHCCNIHL